MLLSKNRKAFHDYEILEKFLAGIVLQGYEVKAIREGNVNLTGAFVTIIGGKVQVTNMHIGKYSKQSQKYDEATSRKSRPLLLSQSEIFKLTREVSEKGKTAVPLALLLKHNKVKVEIGVVRGRKKFEKKAVAKERQIKKDMAIERKEMGL